MPQRISYTSSGVPKADVLRLLTREERATFLLGLCRYIAAGRQPNRRAGDWRGLSRMMVEWLEDRGWCGPTCYGMDVKE